MKLPDNDESLEATHGFSIASVAPPTESVDSPKAAAGQNPRPVELYRASSTSALGSEVVSTVGTGAAVSAADKLSMGVSATLTPGILGKSTTSDVSPAPLPAPVPAKSQDTGSLLSSNITGFAGTKVVEADSPSRSTASELTGSLGQRSVGRDPEPAPVPEKSPSGGLTGLTGVHVTGDKDTRATGAVTSALTNLEGGVGTSLKSNDGPGLLSSKDTSIDSPPGTISGRSVDVSPMRAVVSDSDTGVRLRPVVNEHGKKSEDTGATTFGAASGIGGGVRAVGTDDPRGKSQDLVKVNDTIKLGGGVRDGGLAVGHDGNGVGRRQTVVGTAVGSAVDTGSKRAKLSDAPSNSAGTKGHSTGGRGPQYSANDKPVIKDTKPAERGHDRASTRRADNPDSRSVGRDKTDKAIDKLKIDSAKGDHHPARKAEEGKIKNLSREGEDQGRDKLKVKPDHKLLGQRDEKQHEPRKPLVPSKELLNGNDQRVDGRAFKSKQFQHKIEDLIGKFKKPAAESDASENRKTKNVPSATHFKPLNQNQMNSEDRKHVQKVDESARQLKVPAAESTQRDFHLQIKAKPTPAEAGNGAPRTEKPRFLDHEQTRSHRLDVRIDLLDSTRRHLDTRMQKTNVLRTEGQEFRVLPERTRKVIEPHVGRRDEILPIRIRTEAQGDGAAEGRHNKKAEERIVVKDGAEGKRADVKKTESVVKPQEGSKGDKSAESGLQSANLGPGGSEDEIKKKIKKLRLDEEANPPIWVEPERGNKDEEEARPDIFVQPVEVTVESDDDEEKNQDEWLQEAIDAEERRQRQLTMLATAASTDPNQQQQQNAQATTGGVNVPVVDPSAVLPQIDITEPESVSIADSVESGVSDQATLRLRFQSNDSQSEPQPEPSMLQSIEQRYDLPAQYAEQAAEIEARRDQELLGYELREQELRQLREAEREEKEEREENRKRELQETAKRLVILNEKQRKPGVDGRDLPRVKYTVMQGDTLESIAIKRLRDKRLAALIFEINKQSIPWRVEHGRRYVVLKAGTKLMLPNHADIARHFATRTTSTLPFGYDVPAASGLQDGRNRLPSEEESQAKIRRQNIEKLLGPLCEPAEQKPYCIVRLGDTLNGLARRHPLLQDETLWTLLAEINGLSCRADENGFAIAKLSRGDKLTLPSAEEILEYRTRTRQNSGETTICEEMGAVDVQPALPSEDLLACLFAGMQSAPSTSLQSSAQDYHEYVLLEEGVRLQITFDQNSRKEVRYCLEVLRCGWMPMRIYELSCQGKWYRHEFDATGNKKSYLLDLPDSTARELAHNDLYTDWEAYLGAFLRVSNIGVAAQS